MTVTIADCMRLVGERYGIDKATMIGRCRKRKIARPRMMVMTLAREVTGASLPRIGQQLGRDHTTVLSGIRRMRKVEAKSERIRIDMQNFRLVLLTWKYQQGAVDL